MILTGLPIMLLFLHYLQYSYAATGVHRLIDLILSLTYKYVLREKGVHAEKEPHIQGKNNIDG